MKKYEKKIEYFCPTEVADSLTFLIKKQKIKTKLPSKKNFDLVFFLDFSDIGMVEEFGEESKNFFEKQNIIVIDHHQNDPYKSNKLAIKDKTASSNCQIIYKIISELRPEELSPYVASTLYMGLITDTGNFLFGTNGQLAQSLEVGKKLLEYGADKEFITKSLFYQNSLKSTKFLQKILDRTEQKHKILYSYYSEKDIRKYHIDNDQAMMRFNSVIGKIFGPELIVLFKKNKKQIKCSVRRGNNKNNVERDCAKLASNFGGGGHVAAAGFTLPTSTASYKKQIKKTIRAIDEYMDNSL